MVSITKKRIALYSILLFLGLGFFAHQAQAQNIPLKAWKNLSDKDITPQGKQALSVDPKEWKHSESAHFIYHFKDEKKSYIFYEGAETYYEWIKNLFNIKQDSWKKKVHIFIFEKEEEWKKFASENSPHGFAHGFSTGWELFVYLNPAALAPRHLIAHELTHVIVFRFLDGPIALSLNEGFSDYVAYKAVGNYVDGNQYRLRSLDKISSKNYIPLKEITGSSIYPKDVPTFYKESEALVRFLIDEYGAISFYNLLTYHSKGFEFESALKKFYSIDLKTLEAAFKKKEVT